MSLKTLIFFGLLAVALGFTLPEEQVDSAYAESEWADAELVPIADDLVLIRRARSPQGRIEGRFENNNRHGSRANVDYVHPVNKDLDVWASGRRDFSRNDNSGHVGVKWRF